MYVGIGDTGLTRTLTRADRLADAGADFLVVAAPFYYTVSAEASIAGYFETVAERAAAPVVLYNIPQNTHVALAPSTVRRLAAHPNIVGIKNRRATGSPSMPSSLCGRKVSASCRDASTSRRSRSGRAPTA